jgi:hypothetical protein
MTIAALKTSFMRANRSAKTIAGTMMTKEIKSAGR